jgi:hypothetical protein
MVRNVMNSYFLKKGTLSCSSSFKKKIMFEVAVLLLKILHCGRLEPVKAWAKKVHIAVEFKTEETTATGHPWF